MRTQQQNTNPFDFEKIILQKIGDLPHIQKKEVLDFIDFLTLKNSTISKPSLSLNFKWEDALKQFYKNISSIELQHKIWEI